MKIIMLLLFTACFSTPKVNLKLLGTSFTKNDCLYQVSSFSKGSYLVNVLCSKTLTRGQVEMKESEIINNLKGESE